MIVLEGPDGSGKSTLAELLQIEYPDYAITHSPGPYYKEITEERNFWNVELCKIKNIIVDRISIISESIYGKVMRDGNSLVTNDHLRHFLGEFYSQKFNVLVFCNQRFKPIIKGDGSLYLKEEEKLKFDHEVEEKLELLRAAYIEFFNYWKSIFQKVNYIEINYFKDYLTLFEILKETQKNNCQPYKSY